MESGNRDHQGGEGRISKREKACIQLLQSPYLLPISSNWGSRGTGPASKASELFHLSCRWCLESLMYCAVGWECFPEVWASLSLLWTPVSNNRFQFTTSHTSAKAPGSERRDRYLIKTKQVSQKARPFRLYYVVYGHWIQTTLVLISSGPLILGVVTLPLGAFLAVKLGL